MPEGDTVHRAARRLESALVGREVVGIETPQSRHRHDRWPERLEGKGVRGVDAHGKHLFVRFEGDLTVHSHLRMGGSWRVYRRGEPWRRSPARAWLVIRTAVHAAVQFDGPVLELLSDGRTRFDRRLAALGPDLLADDFDEARALRRLRQDDPTRGVGDALLDQRNVAGIGNAWKAEACFSAGLDPWRPLAEVSDDEIVNVLGIARREMRHSVERPARLQSQVYRRAGLPCPRCGARIRSHGQGDENRTAYWCPSCQT